MLYITVAVAPFCTPPAYNHVPPKIEGRPKNVSMHHKIHHDASYQQSSNNTTTSLSTVDTVTLLKEKAFIPTIRFHKHTSLFNMANNMIELETFPPLDLSMRPPSDSSLDVQPGLLRRWHLTKKRVLVIVAVIGNALMVGVGVWQILTVTTEKHRREIQRKRPDAETLLFIFASFGLITILFFALRYLLEWIMDYFLYVRTWVSCHPRMEIF
ncbi:hypothetical protein BU24DRAFT_199726 [Aaosphaeria arxii CBS 175.79]|uniref:Uncharacterized protein n=1 Tax=Aaosphaeria arxii CBS 175.79 TaxID=1450172 RepID=A0A6A5XT09_9PLEO|nr:uncharacterized protein BU24DRAFT_199726 [Aaosphaeria arxii CBS 175.79]KAF2016332.1 hypothetical protein BU24DRAFT_199726 [Aaosphaeria arxii CBS 175.79]